MPTGRNPNVEECGCDMSPNVDMSYHFINCFISFS